MRVSTLVIGAALLGAAGCKWTHGPAAPQIDCAESSFNFGVAAPGDDVHHVFVVRNTGRELLHIQRAQGS